MRAILLITPVLLVGFADSAPLMLGALYLAGLGWLAFECWRAPIVDEQSDIQAHSSKSQATQYQSGNRKLA
jgi:hypothetical protein